jgi:hypothetical protein
MKALAVTLASSLLLAAPALADSVTTSETMQTQQGGNAVIVAPQPAPPVAETPMQERTRDSHAVIENDQGVKETDKHTEQTVTPGGSATTTTKIERQSD